MNNQRDCFSNAVMQRLEHDPRAVFITADIGTDRIVDALARFPDRCLNVGIREALAVGVAAGYALEGYRPIVHSYAPFVVDRVYEQLKLDLGHQGVGAVVATVGASHDWSAGGFTHHAPADVALISTLPDWTVYVPGHADEVAPLLDAAMADSGPVYLRLSEAMNERARPVEPGQLYAEELQAGAKFAIIAVGPMLERARRASDEWTRHLFYATTPHPLNLAPLAELGVTDVVVVEPYLQGTTAASLVGSTELPDVRWHCLGVQRTELRRYGSAAEHDAAHGLDETGLRKQLRAVFER